MNLARGSTELCEDDGHLAYRRPMMKVRIEVTTDELEDMGCDSVDELAARLREQLDSGIVGEAGEAVSDWLVSYELTAKLAG